MAVYKSQTRYTNGRLFCIATTTNTTNGFYAAKEGETEPTIDLRAKALNRLRVRLAEKIDEYDNPPTYRAGYIRGVAMLFEHDEPTNIDRGEPVLVLTYKDNKLSARANWGKIEVKGPRTKEAITQAINKLIIKSGNNPEDYTYQSAKFRNDLYILVKGW